MLLQEAPHHDVVVENELRLLDHSVLFCLISVLWLQLDIQGKGLVGVVGMKDFAAF